MVVVVEVIEGVVKGRVFGGWLLVVWRSWSGKCEDSDILAFGMGVALCTSPSCDVIPGEYQKVVRVKIFVLFEKLVERTAT